MNKKVLSILTVLLLVSSAFVATSLLVSAHTPPWIYPTWTYIGIQNNPTPVNQQVLLVFWTNQVPLTAAGMYGDRYTFYVDVIKPDGQNETLGPYKSDPVGGSWCLYTPTQVGSYKAVARNIGIKLTGIPGQEKSAYVNDTILPSTSQPVQFTVQQELIQPYPETPLPSGYWTRPINSANRAWKEVASNWLNTAHNTDGPTVTFARGVGPESAHVLWSRPLWSGGIMDARYEDLGYDTIQYEGNLGISPPIIIDGKFFYNDRANPRSGWWAVDLYTGETLYFHNSTGDFTGGGQSTYPIQGRGFDAHGGRTGEMLNYGQMLYVELPNQHGGYPYLWSTTVPNRPNTWRMFDAYSGNYICDIANVSASGTQFVDEMGSICYANIVNLGTTSNPNYYLQIWNTTEAIWFRYNYGSQAPRSPTWPMVESAAGATVNTYWMWRPYPNVTFDGRNGFSFNQSIASVLGPRNSIVNQTGTIRAVRADEYVIVGAQGLNDERGIVKGFLRAYSLKAPDWGKVLWETTFTPPSATGNRTISLSFVDPEDAVFVFNDKQELTWYGYDIGTGEQIWKGEPEVAFNYYGMGGKIYQGMLLSHGYGGQIRAYDIKTGKIAWTYNATNVGFESPYAGNYPTGIGVIADGKLYLTTGEHSFTQPMYRGPNLRCIDAATGQEIWTIQFRGGGMSPTSTYTWIADGMLLSQNADDAQVYAFGKGPSETTVTTLQTVASLGSKVMLTGTVTDQSPSGRHNINGKLDFTLKGTPAISDADMTAWMEYMFMQREFPKNAKGVTVHLTAIDSNGNIEEIGSAVSDTSGNYGLAWTPKIEGTYKVIASFDGSKSYGGSQATTYLTVVPKAAPDVIITSPPTETAGPTGTAAPTQTTPTPASPSPYSPPKEGTPTTTYIAIGAAVIVIIAAAAALILRKRK